MTPDPVPIGYVQSAAERGGTEVILVNTLRNLNRERFAPVVFILSSGPFVEELRNTGTEVVELPARRTSDFRATRRTIAQIANEVRQRGIRLVHSHNPHAHVVGGLVARRTGAASVFHLHGVPSFGFSREGALSTAAVLVPADCTLAVSGYVARAYSRAWMGLRRAEVLYNGIDIAALGKVGDTATVRQEIGFENDAPLVLLPARLQRWKGVHVFVEAAAGVAREHPDARFAVVGGSLFGLEPEYAVALKDRVSALGLESKFVFTGHRSDVYRLMAAADVLVHCSTGFDPFPTVVLEAMALGKPLVASAIGGAAEAVVDGECGYLVGPGDAPKLATAMGALLADRDRAQQMGASARDRFHEKFTAVRMVQDLEQLYGRLIEERAGRSQPHQASPGH